MKYLYSIEGNIGSGKSTLVQFLKRSFKNVIFLDEPVHQWNEIKDLSGETILEKYYNNQKRYSFSFQMMAYITRLSDLRKAFKNCEDNSIIITERCLSTDREIFAKMLYDDGKIEEIEYQIYLRWFNEFIDNSFLSGIIYVKTSPETCLTRIGIRGRKGENIPLEYLQGIHNYHENWINNTSVNTLFLDGEPEQTDILIEQIKAFVKNDNFF